MQNPVAGNPLPKKGRVRVLGEAAERGGSF